MLNFDPVLLGFVSGLSLEIPSDESKFALVERVFRKIRLEDEKGSPLIKDPKLAMETFEAILERGWSFYPSNGSKEGFPRVYRIVRLEES
jgi:hypothetical protein